MQLLTNENLTGLNPAQRDADGDTPDDLFVHYRNYFCQILRAPFEEEEEAWHNLLRSACIQNNIDFGSLNIVRTGVIEEEDPSNVDGTSDANDAGEDADENFVDSLEEV